MDTELANRLAEMQVGITRIDGRCESIHDNQELLGAALVRHEERDRLDFRDVQKRVAKVERRQNWILGVGTSCVFAITLAAAFIKGMFGG